MGSVALSEQDVSIASSKMHSITTTPILRYRAEIDGLRSLAIIPVILYHAGIPLLRGGYVGVDIFFVISGYLITSTLLSDIHRNKFSVLNFYERRARRILPPLFIVLLFCSPVALIWLDPYALREFSQSMFSVATFSSNILFYFKTGYFDTATQLKPLLHTWSLAVEEQFYIVLPLIVAIFYRRNKLPLYAFIASLFVLSLISSQYLVSQNPSAGFYLIYSRAWELLIGSFSAFLLNRRSLGHRKNRFSDMYSLTGLALIIGSIVFLTDKVPFPGLYALLPTAGTFLVIVFANEGTFAATILSNRILVGIGLISYSLYLWHQPLFTFFRIILLRNPSYAEVLAIVCAMFLLSWASYYFVETPIRKKRVLKSQKQILAASAGCLVLFAVCGALGHSYRGFPGRNKGYLRIAQNMGISLTCSGAPLDDAHCKTNDSPKVILWGDSYAMHLGNPLSSIFKKAGLMQATLSSCPPVPNYLDAPRKASITCFDYNARVETWLFSLQRPQDYLIVMSSSIDLSRSTIKNDFIANVHDLQRKGFTVLLISSPPRYEDTETCLIRNIRQGGDFGTCDYKPTGADLQYFANMQALADGLQVNYVSLYDLFCDADRCHISHDGTLLMRDNGHLSIESKDRVSYFIAQKIAGNESLKKWLN
jgi:peptidoglycan/LPS O-acetylase OafA/YrhL